MSMDNDQNQHEKGTPVHGGSNMLKDISLPALVIHKQPLQHNIKWMQDFASRHGAELAPHGKTTMTPALFKSQIDQGAWGITLATPQQCLAAVKIGIRRILMANQLVGRPNMHWIAKLLRLGVDYYCLVDSQENASQLSEFFAKQKLELQVLVEIGVEGGRCGCRSFGEAKELARFIRGQEALRLVGIEGYEGLIHGQHELQDVKSYATSLIEIVLELNKEGYFETNRPIITASGSKWFDVIAQSFDTIEIRESCIILLRPGCYVVHDHRLYCHAMEEIQKRNPELEDALLPAMEVFSHVISLPEENLAIVGMGKRDIGHEPDLPMPQRLYQQGGTVRDVSDWQVFNIMDQHSFLKVPSDHGLHVGDVISFGTSHPCLTFDKWRQICLVDNTLEVIELLETRF